MALGSVILVPVVNPESAVGLVRVAARLAAADGGSVVPVSVVSPESGSPGVDEARNLVVRAEAAATEVGVEAHGLVSVDSSIVAGVLDAAEERAATLVLMGWRGESTLSNVFGQLIDSVIGRSSIPLAVVRLDPRPYGRILLPVSDDHLVPAGSRGVELAARLVERLAAPARTPVWVLRTGHGDEPLPTSVTALGDRVHHDQRRIDLAVGTLARHDDLVVVPVAPTVSGLRAATTHVAWAAPDASLLVAVDVGPVPERGLEDAVSAAGAPPPRTAGATAAQERLHTVAIIARLDGGAPAPEVLEDVVGDVAGVEAETAEHPAELRARVRLRAPDANAALATVMTALHEAPEFQGAEIRYDLTPG